MSYGTVPAKHRVQQYTSRISRMTPTTFAYCALVVLGAFFGAATGGYGLYSNLGPLILVVGGMALVVWGQWFINDVYDAETDKHSNAHRETTNGAISSRESLIIGWLLTGIGFVVTVPLGRYAVLAMAAYIAINTAYSVPPLRTKRGGISSMVILGTMGACSVLLGGAALHGTYDRTLLVLATSMVVVMALSMSYKDLKDADHDAKSGVRNFAVRYGAQRVRTALLLILPAVYLAQPALFGLGRAVPVFGIFSVTAFYLLYTWDGADAIVFRLDALNAIYLITLGAVFYHVV